MTRQLRYEVDTNTDIAEIVKTVLRPPAEAGGLWHTHESVVTVRETSVSIRVPPYGWGTDETLSTALLKCYLAGYLNAVSDQRVLATIQADIERLKHPNVVRH